MPASMRRIAPSACTRRQIGLMSSSHTIDPHCADDGDHRRRLHRRARGAAPVGARLHRARADAARPALGAGRVVPRRGVRQARRPGTAGAEVPGRVRRAGRRLPARGGADRGARAASAQAARPPASARTSTSPRRRSGSSAPRSRSSATWCPPSAARRSARSAITEPGAGSDVAVAAHARRAGRRRLPAQRREDLHHERRARAFHRHRGEDDRARAATTGSRS